MRPACRAKSGSLSGPKTNRATTTITIISGMPISNMVGGSELAGGRESEVHAGEVAAPAGQGPGDPRQLGPCRRLRVGEHDRPAGVAALAEPGVERHLAEQRHVV